MWMLTVWWDENGKTCLRQIILGNLYQLAQQRSHGKGRGLVEGRVACRCKLEAMYPDGGIQLSETPYAAGYPCHSIRGEGVFIGHRLYGFVKEHRLVHPQGIRIHARRFQADFSGSCRAGTSQGEQRPISSAFYLHRVFQYRGKDAKTRAWRKPFQQQ